MPRPKLPPGERNEHTSVGLPPDQCDLLRALARQRRVSVSWLVRDAVEQYLVRLGLAGAPEQVAS